MIDSPVNADIYLLNSSGQKQWTCDMVAQCGKEYAAIRYWVEKCGFLSVVHGMRVG